MAKLAKQFIIVDDDHFSNLLSKIVLGKLFEEVEVKDFLVPELALDYIKAEFEYHQSAEKTTLFLDINMPTLSGWEFLNMFDKLSEAVKNNFQIYMLSSSIDPADIQRAKQNPLVIDFIEKPLNKAVLMQLFG
ncbi:response regulator [Flavobacterium azooxidireducens]|uniref:Response regulator n=1 Tax=Flavobacterium azooxidireducens TaxID=1871076 RepID=A0ABY4KCD9_9FLAO|nr:response regulator [Flavobacterium azooxidireducens]UPQ77996.1 response regulator [Flavobacterium azooxidireducens]